MKKFTFGFIIGVICSAIAAWILMPKLMLTVRESKFDVEKTVAEIKSAAEKNGWQVPKIYNIQASLQKAGYKDATPVKIMSLCQPDHAYKILKDNEDRKVSAIMPCRIGIFKADDGKTYISGMNMGLMGKMFGGTIAKVIACVSEEEHRILKNVIKK